MKYLPLLLTAACLWGCGARSDVRDSADEVAIRALQTDLARAFQQRDFDAVLRCYADDAVLQVPGHPPLEGRAAIFAELRRAFSDPSTQVELHTSRIEVSGSADLAFSWGTGLTTGASDPSPAASSQWLAVYRKRDGVWRIAADTFSAGPAPAP